jgi:hypothetical protein
MVTFAPTAAAVPNLSDYLRRNHVVRRASVWRIQIHQRLRDGIVTFINSPSGRLISNKSLDAYIQTRRGPSLTHKNTEYTGDKVRV